MSVEIIYDAEHDVACFACNTSDFAFGPLFRGAGAEQDAYDFLTWLAANPQPGRMSAYFRGAGRDGTDVRQYDEGTLEELVHEWRLAERADEEVPSL